MSWNILDWFSSGFKDESTARKVVNDTYNSVKAASAAKTSTTYVVNPLWLDRYSGKPGFTASTQKDGIVSSSAAATGGASNQVVDSMPIYVLIGGGVLLLLLLRG